MHPLTLRTKFVLVLLFGAIAPLGLVGYWLARSTEASGEDLLQRRLEETLADVGRELGSQWLVHRSTLLDIAAHPAVLGSPETAPVSDISQGEELDRLAEPFTLVSVRDGANTPRLQMASEARTANFTPALPVEVEVYAPRTGDRVGTVTARVRWDRLLSGGAAPVGVAGSVLAAFDATTGEPVLVPSIDPQLMRQDRFDLAGEPWISAALELSEPPIGLVLSAPLGPFAQPFEEAARRGTLALALVAAASFLLVTLVTGRVTGSLRRLAGAADAIARGDLEQRVEEDGNDELARVATSFNAMTTRLRETLRELAQRRSLAAVGEFAASLAHEVRNPLSSIRLDLQRAKEKIDGGAGAELVERALRSVDRLDGTVTGALTIARSGQVDRRPVDLSAVVDAAMRSARPEFDRRSVRLTRAEMDGATPVLGDSAALEQVFLNLLLNAAQASEAGGRTTITMCQGPEQASVSVTDDGRGVPVENRGRIFEAFYSTRPEGTGLGLPMARQIVAAHGGEITISDTEPAGTTVTVRIPTGDEQAAAL